MSHYIIVWEKDAFDATYEAVRVVCICGKSAQRRTTGEAMRWFVSHNAFHLI